MKLMKKLICMALACITLLGIAIPTNAYSTSNDPYIKGRYKAADSWSGWSSWTLNQLESDSLNEKKFTGQIVEEKIQIQTRTCYIRKDGTIDNVYNIIVGLRGGYQRTAKQYRFRTRIMYWVNSEALPTGMQLLNCDEKQKELYIDMEIARIHGSIMFGKEWAAEQLAGEVAGLAVCGLPKNIRGFTVKCYNLSQLADSAWTLYTMRNQL